MGGRFVNKYPCYQEKSKKMLTQKVLELHGEPDVCVFVAVFEPVGALPSNWLIFMINRQHGEMLVAEHYKGYARPHSHRPGLGTSRPSTAEQQEAQPQAKNAGYQCHHCRKISDTMFPTPG